MGDTLEIFGIEYTNVAGIKAADDNGNIKTYVRPQGTKSITSNGTGIDVTGYASVDVSVSAPSPSLQSKTKSYTPTESAQTETVSADNGYDGLSEVEITVSAISSTYVGSGIDRNDSTDLTSSGATVSVPAGYYAESASKSISNGSATTPATAITANPSISVNTSTGLITASTSASQSVTPTVSAGYVSSGTAGTITVSGSNTSQLSTQAGTTITPTESEQTAVAANKYTLGAVKVGAISSTYIGSDITVDPTPTASGATVTIPEGYYSEDTAKSVTTGSAGTPTATKGTVSSNSISITPSVTNTTGYITGGTKTGTAVTVSASELVSGNKSITSNGTNIDVTNYATASVTVTPSLQAKTNITPTESSQTIEADNAYDGLSSVQINAISSTYVGSGITQRSSTDLTASGDTVTVPAGYYSSQATKSVSSMTLPTSASSSATSGYTSKATIGRSTSDQYINIPTGYNSAGAYYKVSAVANGSATGPSSLSGSSATVTTGTNTITLTKTGVSTTPTVSAGYISSATSSTATVALTASVTTKAAATITPGTTNQTIASGTYLTGTQTISGDANLVASNIISGKSIFGVSGNVSFVTYYTGSSDPSSSLGSNNDIYLKVVT